MNSPLRIALNANPEQERRLAELQLAVSQVCNALVPVVRANHCWNRVALHHLAYHDLRQKFPNIGSQMVCNAIYSVSRACRTILQSPNSPWLIARGGDAQLPLFQFLPTSPVFFDRHTLSVKGGAMSMYTLDGRMKFELALSAQDEARFAGEKLREIALAKRERGFELTFRFSDADSEPEPSNNLPEYVLVQAPDAVAQREDVLASANLEASK